jgi:glutathione S-transferase
MAAAPRLTLYYFDIHGLGARIRLACRVGGVALEDVRFADRDEFHAMRAAGKLPFGQVPLLRVAHGGAETTIAQSAAILRYVCRLGGLYPDDPLQAAAVDAALDAEKDAWASYGSIAYRDRNGFGSLDDAAVAAVDAAINAEVLPRHLRNLEVVLGGSATGWVAGTARPAPCDFAWGTALHALRSGQYRGLDAAVMASDALPRCNAFVDKFMALPEVKDYYEL